MIRLGDWVSASFKFGVYVYLGSPNRDERTISSGSDPGDIVCADSDSNRIAGDLIPMTEMQNIAESVSDEHARLIKGVRYFPPPVSVATSRRAGTPPHPLLACDIGRRGQPSPYSKFVLQFLVSLYQFVIGAGD